MTISLQKDKKIVRVINLSTSIGAKKSGFTFKHVYLYTYTLISRSCYTLFFMFQFFNNKSNKFPGFLFVCPPDALLNETDFFVHTSEHPVNRGKTAYTSHTRYKNKLYSKYQTFTPN